MFMLMLMYIPHVLVLLLCGVILNHHIAQIQSPGTDSPPDSKVAMAASESESESDVKELLLGVKIHRNPSQSKLGELGVASWPTWKGSPGEIPWTFSGRETMYILEGKVKVSWQGESEYIVEIGAGDLVEFPKGMKIRWNVIEAVKKHYKLDDE